MVIVRIIGGLGNQMFQYAAARNLARRLGVEAKMDLQAFEHYKLWPYQLNRLRVPQDIAGESDMLRVGIARGVHFGRMARFKWPSLTFRRRRTHYDEAHFHFEERFMRLTSPCYLRGYFQSEHYFADCAEDVRAWFAPCEPISVHSGRYADEIRSTPCPVSLHVRRGDYVANATTLAVHGSMRPDYYGRAMRILEGMSGEAPHYFIFSDDEAYVRDVFADLPAKTFVTGNAERPWEDMHLMSRCRHHIIANSSFGWWGAWLNRDPDKIVIAPRQWFAPEELRVRNTTDLFPPGWILV